MGSEKEMELDGRIASAILTSEVAGLLNFDLEESIGVLLAAAAGALQSGAASILVRKDDRNGDLIFLKAIGKVGDQLSGKELPEGKGIAGFVAASGQPMAISDVGSEESFYKEFDKRTGFSTEMLLATPLFFDGEVIGVLEFINRRGEPPHAPYSPEEMDRAAIYADAIAALVNSYLATSLSTSLAERICSDRGEMTLEQLREAIQGLRGKKEHKELLELAVLLKKISDQGEGHRKLCKELLESIINFAADSEGVNYSDV